MKNLFIGIASGVLIGAGAILGISQIPSVNKALIKGTDSNSVVDVEKENQIAELELSNTKLKEDINKLNNQITETNAQLSEKDKQITEKQTLIIQLTAEKEQLETINNQLQNVDIPNLTNEKIALSEENATLKTELDRYKELVGSDVNYIELINNLNSELETTTASLETATAELEQLRVDKETLQTRVTELETELESVKEELANYKSLENIDKLNVSSFEGVWYENGEFKDYYTIENGVVTHNANEDKGLLNNIYNQMYLMMNTTGGKAIELSDDGTSFTTADNRTYSKFYINKIETVLPDYSFAGTYSHSTEEIKINADNTLSITQDGNTYYGAYTVTTKEKNVGGNITRINTITATYQINDESVVKEYTNTSRENLLVNSEDNISYDKTAGICGTILSSSASSQYVPTGNEHYKIIVKTNDYITIKSKGYVSLNVSWLSYSSNGHFSINGVNYSAGSATKLYNSTDKMIKNNVFEFYLEIKNSNTWKQSPITNISCLKQDNNFNSDCNILSVEKINSSDYSLFPLFGSFEKIYNLNEISTIECSSVQPYINGTYSNEDTSVDINSESTIITPTGSDAITATSTSVKATTDGTDIYQVVTITYSTIVDEVETTHTMIINLKNDNYVSSTLDSEEITLQKN